VPQAFEAIWCLWAAWPSAQEKSLGFTARYSCQRNEQVLSVVLDDSVAEVRVVWELGLCWLLRL